MTPTQMEAEIATLIRQQQQENQKKAPAPLGIGARGRDLDSKLGECRAHNHGDGRGPSSTDDHLTYASDCHSSCHCDAGARKEELAFRSEFARPARHVNACRRLVGGSDFA
jgi:hypothetical protein